jgi:YVTN family beta-propeller protein
MVPVNADVQSIILNPSERRIYTANRANGTVSIIDADKLQVTATVPVTPQPIGLIPNPLDGKVYVAGFNGLPPYVNAIKPISHTVAQLVLPAGLNVVTWARSFSFAVDEQQNRIWFSNAIGPVGDVTVLDGPTHVPVARFTIRYPGLETSGSIPYSIAFNAENNKAYVLGYSALDADQLARLTILDGTSFQVIRQLSPLSPIAGSGFPTAIFYNPVNNKIYCALCKEGLVVLDGETDQVLRRLPVDGCHFTFAVNPDRDAVYVTSWEPGKVYVVDGESDRLIRTIDDVHGALGAGYNQATGNLYVLATAVDKLVVIDGAEDEILWTCPAGPFPTVIINNDGATVVSDHATGRTFFVNMSSSGMGSVGVALE